MQRIRENDEIDVKDAHVHSNPGTALATKMPGMSLGELCARDWYKGNGHRDVWLSKEYTDFQFQSAADHGDHLAS